MGNDYKEKYIVFKLDEWLDWNPQMGETAMKHVDDAVVIRLQDTFAPGALWAYANSVATMLDVFEDFGIGAIPVRDEAAGLEASRQMMTELQQVHEYFIAMAVKADEIRRKLPTP